MNRFAATLLEWYSRYGRELPWRGTRDPYRIWISEIILQQTRVEQGYDYFLRFVSRFPDLESLAAAHEDEVMKYWQGLGYYSRARNLHAAARQMQGHFPTTYEGVRALKGVGDYTAAAICSIAYGLPHAVVDGNVYRVLARYHGIETPIDSTPGRKFFAALARDMMDEAHPALYNQAIMDFGAMQCTPRQPRCGECPLADSCVALARKCVDDLPMKQHKTKTTDRYFIYIYVRTGAYTFIRKRTGSDIWRNLYELPLIECDRALGEEEIFSLPEMKNFQTGEEKSPVIRCLQRGVRHVLSHRVIHADFYELLLPDDAGRFCADTPLLENCLRVKVEELGSYAVPRLIQAFFEKYL
ncbi:MAG: A/G-specific adenine glycosylase [Bacteroides sp.]|nr:A/G-specific adenine glycosylase [Bacteroides sp.]